ncbi:MAG: hypothetical protein EXQ56_02020 [Acidobacteria bacterium]|nr:hypothetical protein [Acidobacteriota bacterium]
MNMGQRFAKWGTTGAILMLAGILLLASPRELRAQLPVGNIAGGVHDASGAVIPGVAITATNRDTGLVRSTVSGSTGRYVVPALPVGEYDVKAEAPAFAGQIRQNIVVAIGQESVINFSLAVGSVAEAVTITGEAPLIETTSGAVGGLVNEQRVQELPLNGRNFNELVLLQAGINVHKQTSSTSSTGTGLVFSSNGAPIRSNFMTLDGANMASAEGLTGVSVTGSMLGIEGIQEYRVITNSFPAEYGMTMGSQITVATKSGTNRFRGSMFEFLRNSNLDASNFFYKPVNPLTDPRIPAFRRNNFGGAVGGPVIKDKSFFFLTYEGNRERLGDTKVLATPTAAARQNGGLVPTINAAVRPYLNLYPLPTGSLPSDPNQLSGVGRYIYVFKQPTREDFGQARVDHSFSETDSMFTRYTISDNALVDSAENWPEFPRFGNSRGQFLTVAESHTFSPVLLNQVRASFSRTFGRFDSATYEDPNLEFLPGFGLGGIAPGSGVTGIGPSTPWIVFNQNLYTLSNDIYYTAGSHSWKFGTLINRYHVFTEPTTSRRGSYAFSNITNFLNGIPQSFGSETPGSNTYKHYAWYTLGFYLQDDWRVTPRLTLNLGLRYESHTSVNEQNDRGSHFADVTRDRLTIISPELFHNNSKKNFGPRFGFAWDPKGDARMAVRGGFGLLYDIANMAAAAQVAATGTPPFASRSTITAANASATTPAVVVAFPRPNLASALQARGARITDYNLQQPHMLHYNLTVERQLPASFSVSAAFVGTRGINLYQTKEGNPVVPGGIPLNGTCVARPAGQTYVTDGPKCWLIGDPRLNPNWAEIELKSAAADSWYNGFQMTVNKRMGNGLQMQSSYTFSKALDTTQGQKGGEAGGAGNTGLDPDNPAYDKGASDSDTRHNWTVNGLYRLPLPEMSGIAGVVTNGWRLGGIFSAKSGLPFTPLLSGNRSRSLVSAGVADRPDIVPGRTPEDIILGGPDKYFDTSAFTVQNVGLLGTSPRNFLQGPGQVNLDLSLAKEFNAPILGESGRLDFRFEMFNIFNHPNFNIPVAGRTVFTATENAPLPGVAAARPPAAGSIDRTRSDARKIQFGLKLNF